MTLELRIHAAISLSKRKSPIGVYSQKEFVKKEVLNANDSRVDNSCSHLLVKEMESKAISDPLQLRDRVSDALDGSHLILQELVHKVREVGVTLGVRGLGELEKALVHHLLQLEGGLHGLEAGAPLHAHRLGNVLEDTTATSLALVGHQLHPVLPLLLRLLGKVGCKARQGLVVSREVGGHGEIDIGGVELHVDLLVDQSLAVFVVVLPDLRHGHPDLG